MKFVRSKQGIVHKATGEKTYCGKSVAGMIPASLPQWQWERFGGNFCWQCHISKKKINQCKI